jgi:hypothetical protein
MQILLLPLFGNLPLSERNLVAVIYSYMTGTQTEE